jgi:hypothetical protein
MLRLGLLDRVDLNYFSLEERVHSRTITASIEGRVIVNPIGCCHFSVGELAGLHLANDYSTGINNLLNWKCICSTFWVEVEIGTVTAASFRTSYIIDVFNSETYLSFIRSKLCGDICISYTSKRLICRLGIIQTRWDTNSWRLNTLQKLLAGTMKSINTDGSQE